MSDKRNALQVRAAWSLMAAVRTAAAREMTTASASTRAALIQKVRADGFDRATFAPAERETACRGITLCKVK